MKGFIDHEMNLSHESHMRQSSSIAEQNQYFNSWLYNPHPAMLRTRDVFKGHLFDAAARVEHGYGYMAGVTLPLHKTLRECFRDKRTLTEITRMDMPGLTPDSKLHETIDPYNLSLTENLINHSSTWTNYERDRNAPTPNYAHYMLTRFPDKPGYVPTPKNLVQCEVLSIARSIETQDEM